MFRRGAVVMVISAALFALMSAQVKALSGVGSYITMMMRFSVGALVVGCLAASGIARVRWTNIPWQLVRGITGGVAVAAFFWGIQNVGLAKATMYCYTYAIFAAVFAGPFLGERLSLQHWLAVAVATIGMALLVGIQHLTVSPADLITLSSGVLSGVAVVAIAKCRETESSFSIFLSLCLFGIAVVAWPTYRTWVMPTAGQWAALLAIGLMATAGQLLMTYAYKFTGAAYGSLLSLLTPVLSAAIGVAYFREQPGSGFYAGSLLVLLACGYLSLHPVRQRPQLAEALLPQPTPATETVS